MATSGPTNAPAFFNTNADFQTWCQDINAALTALGLVNNNDIGSINNATVTKPGAGSTAQGFEVWKFADTLQATTPIYLKLEYGSGAAATTPGLWITAGSGTNGSGTLTGQLSTRTQVGGGAKSAGVTLPLYACGGTGELLLAVNIDTASTGFGVLICVERTKDSTDTATSDGVLVSTLSASTPTSPTAQYVPGTGTVPAQLTGSNAWCGLNPNFWSRSASGSNADASPIFIPVAGVWRYSRLLVSKAGDLPAGGTLSTTIFGAAHTYMALDQTCGTSACVQGAAPGFSIRWE